jgi:hypothetical protein
LNNKKAAMIAFEWIYGVGAGFEPARPYLSSPLTAHSSKLIPHHYRFLQTSVSKYSLSPFKKEDEPSGNNEDF